MKRTEILNLVLSFVAIAISVITPFISYYWLDTTQKDYTDRAVLLITNTDENDTMLHQIDANNYSVTVKNIGKKYADNIKIFATFKKDESGKQTHSNRSFFIRDAVDYELKTLNNFVVATLSTPIPPNKEVTFHFNTGISNAYLVTKYGETLSLWGRGFLGGGATGD